MIREYLRRKNAYCILKTILVAHTTPHVLWRCGLLHLLQVWCCLGQARLLNIYQKHNFYSFKKKTRSNTFLELFVIIAKE